MSIEALHKKVEEEKDWDSIDRHNYYTWYSLFFIEERHTL